MKKSLLIILAAILIIPSVLTAKENKQRYNNNYDYIDYKKSEIYIQYGAPTIIEFTNKFKDNSAEYAKYKSTGKKYTGVGAVGYNFFLNPYVAIGAYFGISEADMEISDESINKVIYKSHVRNYTGMIGVEWTYFRSGIWEASCGCSVGIARKDERQELVNNKASLIPKEKDSFNFAYNLTATRVRVGEAIGGFVEVGFGYKGLVNAGLSVRF